MSPQEFVKLSEEEAKAHLESLKVRGSWTEIHTLSGAWWAKTGDSIMPSGADQTAALQAGNEAPIAMTRNSAMLGFGRVLTGIGIAGALFISFSTMSGLNRGDTNAIGGFLWIYLFSSLGSAGLLFWVAGALEQRLVEIADRILEARKQ